MRSTVAVASVVGLVVFLAVSARQHWEGAGDGFTPANVPFNELARTAADARVETSRSLFQTGLLLLGGLWGLVLVDKHDAAHPVFSGWHQKLLLIASNGFILFSFYAHIQYLQAISSTFLAAAQFNLDGLFVPNLLDRSIDLFYQWQFAALVWGSIVLGLTVTLPYLGKGTK